LGFAVTINIGLASITMGFVGYGLKPLNRIQRFIYILAGLMLLAPLPWIALAGLGVVIILTLGQWKQRREE
jgi:TRAP-type uncharacterized transport system fused permease subunit